MLSAEDAAIASSLSSNLFQNNYSPSLAAEIDGHHSNAGHQGIIPSSNAGIAIGGSSEYALLFDSSNNRGKRTREWTAEETQSQYLDQVEEYQWSQTMAIRSMLQQQQEQQQQQQLQLQLQLEQHLHQLGAQAHPQQYPFQDQPLQSSSYPLQQNHGQQQQHIMNNQGTQQQQCRQQQQQQVPRHERSSQMNATQFVTPINHQPNSQDRQRQLHSHRQIVQQPQQQLQQQQQPMYQSSSISPSVPSQQQLQEPIREPIYAPREYSDHVPNAAPDSPQPIFDASWGPDFPIQLHGSQHERQQQHVRQDGLPQQQSIQQQQQYQRAQPQHAPALNLSPVGSTASVVKPTPSIPSFPYFPPAIQKYSPELSPGPLDEPGPTDTAKAAAPSTSSVTINTPQSADPKHTESNRSISKGGIFSGGSNSTDKQSQGGVVSPSQANIPPPIMESKMYRRVKDQTRKSATRASFPSRAPPQSRSVAQLEEAMMNLKVYDSCLFWGKAGAVNLKPEGNSWDDDMVIQSKDPAWVRNSVQPPNPSNQELLILPPIAKIERSIDIFNKNSHLYPPFITPLIVERAKQTRSDQVSRILLNTIAGIALRIDPDIETTSGAVRINNPASNKAQYMRYFHRAYGLLSHLEDIRSTYSTAYLQATILLCYVYPKPQLRVELLKLMTEAAFLGLHVDASRWMPKPVVIQNRCWLFWACYMFDSVHHVIRGQLTQMDDHYLDAPFPQLTELDTDDGLWTRWFMLKEINLWKVGRKVHSFFQAGLKRIDRLIETGGYEEVASSTLAGSTRGAGVGTANLLSAQEVLANEFSEAELVLSLKFWMDDLPPALMAQLDYLDMVDPIVNGRAVGLQVVYSMLRVLLLYPSVLAIGTDLLAMSLPASATAAVSAATAATPSLYMDRIRMAQQQHYVRRQELLDKIMQCVQEADRIVMLTELLLERYPERVRMSCVGVVLDWCLRIYYKIVVEETSVKTGESGSSGSKSHQEQSPQNQQQQAQGQPLSSLETGDRPFSERLRARCRVQVAKVAKLLKQFEELDHKYFFSWLTIELESLEERQKATQQKMIQKCLEGLPSIDTTGSVPVMSVGLNAMTGSSGMTTAGAEFVTPQQQHQYYSQQQQQQQPQQHGSRPKSHDLQTIIRKRHQMGVYATSGIRPNGGNSYGGATSEAPWAPEWHLKLSRHTPNSNRCIISGTMHILRQLVDLYHLVTRATAKTQHTLFIRQQRMDTNSRHRCTLEDLFTPLQEEGLRILIL
ncbi:hypothetical protein BGZ58_010423 [Dissophora ornata]|nr:hypothetical protein BGZ58_010423 [Dissophora ornata]